MPRGVSKVERKKVFEFIFYPESCPLDFAVRTLKRLRIKAVISPVHDRDVWLMEDFDKWADENRKPDGTMPELGEWPHALGELKKPHHHCVLEFSGPKSRAAVLSLLSPLGVSYVMASPDVQVAKRYLVHLDDPEKAQYKIEDLTLLGGIDMSCLYRITDQQEVGAIAQLFRDIQEGDIVYFCDFCDYVLSGEDYRTAKILISRSGLFKSYIDSYGTKLAAQRYENAHYKP